LHATYIPLWDRMNARILDHHFRRKHWQTRVPSRQSASVRRYLVRSIPPHCKSL
jgi:hypothetical protein